MEESDRKEFTYTYAGYFDEEALEMRFTRVVHVVNGEETDLTDEYNQNWSERGLPWFDLELDVNDEEQTDG
ncbi:hypothetical protein AB0B85_32860 [Micromonospora sp. NPDC049044]|uniref:hypothetical protein n=1 Tax=Micromonospora sp. NPDC049044 TaxID=3154827 RepID=UPI0033E2C322